MTKGIAGNAVQRLLDWTIWQTERTQTLVFVLFLSETLLTSGKEHQTIITHNTSRHCRVRFMLVWDNLCRNSCIWSRWDNTTMRDYSTWNLKIVPFVFRVYQRVFIYIVDLYTPRYLSKHHVIKIDPSDIHLKLLYLTIVFLSTMFPQGRSFPFIAEWLRVFFPSGIRAPWRFSDVDVVTPDTFNFIRHTFSIARYFPLRSTYWAVFYNNNNHHHLYWGSLFIKKYGFKKGPRKKI